MRNRAHSLRVCAAAAAQHDHQKQELPRELEDRGVDPECLPLLNLLHEIVLDRGGREGASLYLFMYCERGQKHYMSKARCQSVDWQAS